MIARFPYSTIDAYKTTIGFEDLFNRIADTIEAKTPTYPPFNIKKNDEHNYVLELAVAGFSINDIDIEYSPEKILTIKGDITSNKADNYLFKGIAERAFTRSFTLADHIEIKNANLDNGILQIWLERVIPEDQKPKKIQIQSYQEKQQLLTE